MRFWGTLGVFVGLHFSAYAYPELIRHGYVHCTSCHVSPAGGGLTTAYGRSISKELLSRWSYEGEEGLLHGVLSSTSVNAWLNSEEDKGFFIGGDLRFIQTHSENEFQRKRSFFPMQSDLEAAYRGEWGSVSVAYGMEKRDDRKTMTLRRWALVLQPIEKIWSRVGLGSPHFALMTSEHNWGFRQDLGFGPLDRRRLGEIEYQGERWGALLGIAEHDETLPIVSRENASYGNFDWIFSSNKKVGVHHWNGRQSGSERLLRGLHAQLGWNEHWVTLAQVTTQNQKSSGLSQHGWYAFQKTSWEPSKGIWISGNIDFVQKDQSVSTTQRLKYGPGIQFFPRPHLELQAVYLRAKDRAASSIEGDEAFLIFHYYL